jgi:KDO2-lipid IV(A) lauroyltransferase
MSFSRTKDRAFGAYDRLAAWLARRPAPVRRAVWSAAALILRAAWLLPGAPLRPTFAALARHLGAPSAGRLFSNWLRAATAGVDRVERVRHGRGAELDPTLAIPEAARLEALLSRRGVFLALPHAHAALAMGRALAQAYPVTAIVRVSADPARATAQHRLYAQMGAEIVDARTESPLAVARAALRAFRDGRIVIAMVDRIAPAPETPLDTRRDLARVAAFGQPVGLGLWPARLAAKGSAPILPAMVEQSGSRMVLHLGPEIAPGPDLSAMSQAMMTGLEDLIRAHPAEWMFCLDKHWSRALRAAPPNAPGITPPRRSAQAPAIPPR